MKTKKQEQAERKARIAAKLTAIDATNFTQDIANDQTGFHRMLHYSDDKGDSMSIADRSLQQKRELVLTRIALVLGGGNMSIDGTTNSKPASANSLPIASYLAGHSGRVMVALPATAENSDAFFNWLTSGSPDKMGISTARTCKKAEQENKVVCTRLSATHAIDVKDGKTSSVKEVKTRFFAFLRMVGVALGIIKSKHYGMNIAGGSGDPDIHGKPPIADGSHGHLYIHYQAPTKTKAGGLLIGLEGAEFSVEGELGNHSMLGAPDLVTPLGGKKWEKPETITDIPEGVIIGKKYSGLRIELSQDHVEGFTNITTDQTIAARKHIHELEPQESLAALTEKIKEKEMTLSAPLHEVRPELVATPLLVTALSTTPSPLISTPSSLVEDHRSTILPLTAPLSVSLPATEPSATPSPLILTPSSPEGDYRPDAQESPTSVTAGFGHFIHGPKHQLDHMHGTTTVEKSFHFEIQPLTENSVEAEHHPDSSLPTKPTRARAGNNRQSGLA